MFAKSKSNEICVTSFKIVAYISINQEQNAYKNVPKIIELMIIDQEEKFKAVLPTIEGNVNEQSFFNAFLDLYPEAWKQHKITFSKFKRSKQFGKTIPLPKPEVSLRKDIRIWLQKQ
ncbi:hypothetical protein LNI90_02790 [Tenacibaculum dicentrarchi]|nr:hypothetical protein [Tenacibaculum dicentrarchi]MCD8406849.1 hypothetical protein [Tenacibaculum dicentrarchi]MCD8414168.1 hypothetical protein [Tenacibaculum dicentrarchi]MCD8419194.1 hypothetical protein [Tenacibaculum dicentrarchi]MCD8424205.1 hypothetical protein [Tenacibaculum dicentrarchi]